MDRHCYVRFPAGMKRACGLEPHRARVGVSPLQSRGAREMALPDGVEPPLPGS